MMTHFRRSLSLSYGEAEQHEAQAQKEHSGACNRDIMDLKMPNFSLRETATFPSLRMAI